MPSIVGKISFGTFRRSMSKCRPNIGRMSQFEDSFFKVSSSTMTVCCSFLRPWKYWRYLSSTVMMICGYSVTGLASDDGTKTSKYLLQLDCNRIWLRSSLCSLFAMINPNIGSWKICLLGMSNSGLMGCILSFEWVTGCCTLWWRFV